MTTVIFVSGVHAYNNAINVSFGSISNSKAWKASATIAQPFPA